MYPRKMHLQLYCKMKRSEVVNYAIVYSSCTGNTARLAQHLKGILPAEGLIYYGPPADHAVQADVLFVGSWTDKGTCSPDIARFLGSLNHKRVYLFGTAGFGGTPAYFDQIAERMAANLPAGNLLLGHYLCQGKMPQTVRQRYESMAQTDPEKARPLLGNFDRALSHPDQQDLEGLEKAVTGVL